MEIIKEWALLVAVCGILAEICSMLMPEGESRKTAMLVLGLVMVFCLVLPAGNLYENLLGLDFSYERERAEIAENLEAYTEDQMLEVTAEFKQRLTAYICELVDDIDGVENAQADFIMEEDYTQETYGTIKRIYVTAYGATGEAGNTQSENSLSSGFLEMAPIARIEITLEGIQVISSGQEHGGEEDASQDDPREEAIVSLLSKTFQLEENCIFAEVKDE